MNGKFAQTDIQKNVSASKCKSDENDFNTSETLLTDFVETIALIAYFFLLGYILSRAVCIHNDC